MEFEETSWSPLPMKKEIGVDLQVGHDLVHLRKKSQIRTLVDLAGEEAAKKRSQIHRCLLPSPAVENIAAELPLLPSRRQVGEDMIRTGVDDRRKIRGSDLIDGTHAGSDWLKKSKGRCCSQVPVTELIGGEEDQVRSVGDLRGGPRLTLCKALRRRTCVLSLPRKMKKKNPDRIYGAQH